MDLNSSVSVYVGGLDNVSTLDPVVHKKDHFSSVIKIKKIKIYVPIVVVCCCCFVFFLDIQFFEKKIFFLVLREKPSTRGWSFDAEFFTVYDSQDWNFRFEIVYVRWYISSRLLVVCVVCFSFVMKGCITDLIY